MLDALPYVTSQKSLATIRKDMAVYVFSGERDPVGANIKGLIQDLKAAGFTQLTTRLYPGARHETLNETNRDEVTRDLIAWLDGIEPRASPPPRGGGLRRGVAPSYATGEPRLIRSSRRSARPLTPTRPHKRRRGR